MVYVFRNGINSLLEWLIEVLIKYWFMVNKLEIMYDKGINVKVLGNKCVIFMWRNR